LYAVVAISVAGWVLPGIPVPLPRLIQPTSAQTAATIKAVADPAKPFFAANSTFVTEIRLTQATRDTVLAQVDRSAPPIPLRSISWSAIALVAYLSIAALMLARIGVGLVFTRRLTHNSETILDPRVVTLLSLRATNGRLRVVPRVAQSELISVPVTVGVWRSAILLPASWRQWTDAKLDAVIAHELSHVARHDALTQLVSLVHRAVFWFSPLAWWLDRHLNTLAEQASDEAALSTGANRNEYARTLLSFFETLQAGSQRVWWQGVSMANAGQAEQRVEKILAWRGAVTMHLKKSVAILVVAFAIPVVYLAASVRPARAQVGMIASASRQEPAPPPESSATPAPPPASATPAVPSAHGVEPVTPVAPVEPIAPVAAIASQSHRHGYSYSYGYDDDERFVIVSGKTDALTMSGSGQDARHVERLRKQIPGDFIWFQRDEKSYIIRDQATVDRARRLWAPQEELGKKQEALGKQQEALGKQQEELGAKMERVQVKVPDMTAELDKLRAELKQLSSGATADQVGHLQSEIGELQSKIGEVQSSAGEQQSKLGEQMSALGEQQSKLGEQQGELGRQQGEIAEKASHEMKQLLDDAIKNGTAKPERDIEETGTL
jgi:beta-lactamase regulating signal transducer with metallopeptidase domain